MRSHLHIAATTPARRTCSSSPTYRSLAGTSPPCQLEKHPREMILRREFAMAVAYLNRVLSRRSALTYIHWDFSRYAKR
ncbi:unnamed protein product [Closterium sp. Naga37s-1]|nr:unnamed protein product [Closterium sp. Naga37s-1]